MVKFNVHDFVDFEENPFDRQERISWWSQDKLRNARVMVVGAGAIGNETLKNLALLGIGNVFIADFDTISTSNLSRTVLFRKTDKGMKKAEVAAQRFKEMSLYEDSHVEWFDGDVAWELGTGVFRRMDVVLGCLDNVETRFAVNKQCWLAGTTWIDAGIYELAGHVSVFSPPNLPCYQCNATEEQLKAARRRYSCDDFKRAMLQDGKMPTVQIASAIVSALQVQEAIKHICGQPVARGKKICFQGLHNGFDIFELAANEHCEGHPTYPEIIEIHVSADASLREFLNIVSQEDYSGFKATLDLSGDRYFVEKVKCRHCGEWIEIYKPPFRTFDNEAVCLECISKSEVMHVDSSPDKQTEKIMTYRFNLQETKNRLLDMTLEQLGVPHQHIVGVFDVNGEYKYYELIAGKQG